MMSRTTQTTPRGPSVYGAPTGLQRIKYGWVQRPRLDYWIGAILAALWLAGTTLASAAGASTPNLITGVAPGIRQAFYQVVLGMTVALAGFALTSVSILINLIRTPISALDEALTNTEKGNVGTTILATLPTVGVTFAAAMCGLFSDATKRHGASWIEYLTIVGLTGVGAAVCRTVWVLRRLVVVTASGGSS